MIVVLDTPRLAEISRDDRPACSPLFLPVLPVLPLNAAPKDR